jgi:hypothetical protein
MHYSIQTLRIMLLFPENKKKKKIHYWNQSQRKIFPVTVIIALPKELVATHWLLFNRSG